MKEEQKINLTEEMLNKKARDLSIKEGSFASLAEGLGNNYIIPYVLSLGGSNVMIGFLVAFSQLIGNIAQIFTNNLLNMFTRKRIAIFGRLVSSLMWLLLLLPAILYYFFGIKSVYFVFFIIFLYTFIVGANAIIAPAWSSWMKDVVHKSTLGTYFGYRNRMVGFFLLFGIIIGGMILEYYKKTHIFIGFMILFFLASIFIFVSSSIFKKMYEPEFKPEKTYYFSFTQFIKKLPSTNFGKFVIFYSLMNLAVYFAAPFFTVYMLKELNFSYVTFMSIVAISPFVKILVMPLWGKFCDSYGNIIALKITAYTIPFIPFLWIPTWNFFVIGSSFLIPYIIIIEIVSGIAWAGFHLSTSNFVFEAVSREKMVLCLSYTNILTGAAIFLGSVLGGIFASLKLSILGLSIILLTFLISFFGRLIVALIFLPKISEVRDVKKFRINDVGQKILHLELANVARYFDFRSNRY